MEKHNKKRAKRRTVTPVGNTRDPRAFYPRLRQYLAWCEMQHYSERTRITREDELLRFFRWCDVRGLCYPSDVTRPMVERYQYHLSQQRQASGQLLSVNTQRSALTSIQSYYRWLIRQHFILSNPAADLELPKQQKLLPRDVLSAAEVEQIMNVPDINTALGLRDRAILEVLYSTGIRRNELCQLEMNHLNEESGTLLVRKGKGNKERLIPIGQRAISWVKQYEEKARPLLACGREERVLFLANDGLGLSSSGLSHLVGGYVKASGVRERGSCHLFRHTMATLMLENGADTRWIQAMLGHENISTTQIYTRVSIRALQEIHAATHPASKERTEKGTDTVVSPDSKK